MSTLGIVLAAGHSTRLPFKVLLPQRCCDKPAMASAVEFCLKNCEETVLVHNGGPVEEVCKYLWPGLVDPVRDHNPGGVLPSVWRGTVGRVYDKALITFADNIYQLEEIIYLGYASTRFQSKCGPCTSQLDGILSDGTWVTRERRPEYKLAGWIHLEADTLQKMLAKTEDLIAALNYGKVREVECTAPWYDIGTEESYTHYMRGGK